MKSIFLACAATLALAGCAGPAYWDHGEWLDRVSVRPNPVIRHTPQEEQALQEEAARLRARAQELRDKYAVEKSRDQRIAYLRQLEAVGDQLRPVEQALRGGPMPYRGLPMEQPANAGA